MISHKIDSNARAVNVDVVWMLPVYTKFLKVIKKLPNNMSVTEDGNVAVKVLFIVYHTNPIPVQNV